MKSKLSSSQIDSYQTNGFLAVKGFLDETELATWRRVTDDAVKQRLAERGKLTNQSNADDYYAQVFTQCLQLANTSPKMKKLIHSPEIGRMVATLAGVDGMRVWHDQALIKPPFGNPTSYHLDNPYWSFSSRQAISIWIALDDATLENGCMWYLPGTQNTARFDNAGIGPNIAGLFKFYPEWRKIAPVSVPVKAGTAVFHHGLVAHGAGANMTNKQRRAMTCGFMPDGSTFNGQRNILEEEYFKSLKVGDLLNNDQWNPLVWPK